MKIFLIRIVSSNLSHQKKLKFHNMRIIKIELYDHLSANS